MSEFAKTIAVALLLLAVLLVFVGSEIDLGGDGGRGFRFAPSGTLTGNLTSRPGAEGFFVGTRPVEDFGRIRFAAPFQVSLLKQTTTHVFFDDAWIARGIMRDMSQRTAFEIKDTNELKGGTLRGQVIDTNRYGSLVAKLNGKTIFAQTLKRGERFQVDVPPSQFSNGTNEFILAASSSTWRVWAPTVYIVDATFESGREGEVAKTLQFSVPQDRLPVESGRLVFKAARVSGTGNLSIEVNGKEVFSGAPDQGRSTLVDFKGALVTRGNNTIGLRATGNADYRVESFELLYFFSRGPSTTATHEFTLTQRDYNALPGTLRFRINKVFGAPTGLAVDLVRPDGTQIRAPHQGSLAEGNTVTVALTNKNTGVGENRAVFRAFGNGGYEITNVQVSP